MAADPEGAASARRARALFDAKGNVAQSSSVP